MDLDEAQVLNLGDRIWTCLCRLKSPLKRIVQAVASKLDVVRQFVFELAMIDTKLTMYIASYSSESLSAIATPGDAA